MISFILAVAAAVQPAAIAPGPRGMGAQERSAIAGQVQAWFSRIDTNRDGFVTREEAQGARAMFRQNGPQRAERRQRAPDPAMQQQRRTAAFDRLDSNRDGAISRAEFMQASALRTERRMVRRVPMGLGGRMFEMADTNRDSRVSLQEATAAAYQRFDTADLNRDGRLTRDERMQRRERLRSAQPRS
jgi:Ca2+-binding EF-hand superfamily protein